MNAPVRLPVLTDDERAERLAEEAWNALRDECEAEFIEWQRADYANREFEDFGNWLVNKARWNRPNKYESALDWSEKKGVGL